MPTLRADIASWDGKSADAITAVYNRQHAKRGFAGSLVRAAAEPDLATGATWLLKHHLEARHTLATDQAAAFFAAASGMSAWEARLHALQIMEYVPVPAGSVKDARKLLDRCASDENKFVRAWACSGWARLAEAHPRFREEATRLLDDAEAHDPAASVRARVRQIRKRWTRPEP